MTGMSHRRGEPPELRAARGQRFLRGGAELQLEALEDCEGAGGRRRPARAARRADHYPLLTAERRSLGNPMSLEDHALRVNTSAVAC